MNRAKLLHSALLAVDLIIIIRSGVNVNHAQSEESTDSFGLGRLEATQFLVHQSCNILLSFISVDLKSRMHACRVRREDRGS